MGLAFPLWILLALAAALILGGLAFFIRPRWITAWLKGSFAVLLLAMGVSLTLFALNLRYYHNLDRLDGIATVESIQLAPQTWRVSLTRPGQKVQIFTLRGDQWQLDARILRFDGLLRWVGLRPMYQLDRLGGRYVTLEQERSEERTVYGLAQQGPVDVWAMDRRIGIPFVEARYGNAVFMPLKDGAQYAVKLGATGLVATPANAIARKAVTDWF